MDKSASISDRKRGEDMVYRFVQRFDDSYRWLVDYAAIPLVLTPELLNYLRVEFLRNQTPWMAEADLLLSDLCREVGYEQYILEFHVRAYLIENLRQRLGMQRLEAIARFLIKYLNSSDLNTSENQTQRWAAMVYLQDHRNQVAEEIALAFQNASGLVVNASLNQSEMTRLSKIVQLLSPQLVQYPELVNFAESVGRLITAKTSAELEGLRRQYSREKLIVSSVSLPTYEELALHIKKSRELEQTRLKIGAEAEATRIAEEKRKQKQIQVEATRLAKEEEQRRRAETKVWRSDEKDDQTKQAELEAAHLAEEERKLKQIQAEAGRLAKKEERRRLRSEAKVKKISEEPLQFEDADGTVVTSNEQEFVIDLPRVGEIRTGIITSISPTQILVSIGAKSEGIISGRELDLLSDKEHEDLKVGKEISVFVLNAEDQNGNVVLSFNRAQEEISWENLGKMVAEDTVIDTKIIGFNKGGLIAAVGNLRGFVPSSQISASRRAQSSGGSTPELRWQKMLGQPISVRIIEVDRERRRLILSERSTNTESPSSIKDHAISELEEGKVYAGKVTSLADFGAFVKINGADGLVHLSELSWNLPKHPKELLEVGQEVQVKVINIDRVKKRIGLSMRALQDDPWNAKTEKFSVGHLVDGVITRITNFGAFARLEGEIEGLIHISEISNDLIKQSKKEIKAKIRDILKEGDVKSLLVIRIDREKHRIGLSLRQIDADGVLDKELSIPSEQNNKNIDTKPTSVFD